MDPHTIWFILLALLLAGYAVLDGFDLGVGILHPLARDDRERRIFINAIGPIWDGNEVWLITFGGALFAAFPVAYATVFSGFYTAFMALLAALIFRAVSIEFRSKRESRAWRRAWDWSFFGSSLAASLLFGVAIGNAMIGVPLDAEYNYAGTFWDLLRPFPLLIGLAVIATFAMHGAMFLYLKVGEGELRERIKRYIWGWMAAFLGLYAAGTAYTLLFIPRSVDNIRHAPESMIVVAVSILAVVNIPRAVHRGKVFQAFLSSGTALAAMVGLISLVLWPNVVTATNPANSLTVQRAASSTHTLWVMLIIAAIGMPFVVGYTVTIYWMFRGKVEITERSY